MQARGGLGEVVAYNRREKQGVEGACNGGLTEVGPGIYAEEVRAWGQVAGDWGRWRSLSAPPKATS